MLRFALAALLLAPAGAQGEAPTLDVLRNGDAEDTGAPRGTHRGAPCYALNGWHLDDAGGYVAQGSGWGGMAAARGAAFVRACKPTPGPLWQDVVLRDDGSARALVVSAYVQTGRDKDYVELALRVDDNAGNTLATRTTGSLRSTGWTRVWLPLVLESSSAARARAARVTFTASHAEGKYLDAFVDDVQLWVIGPGWPVQLAQASEAELVALATDAQRGRLAGIAALMTGKGRARGERLLSDALAGAAGSARDELLVLAALTTHKDAVRLLRGDLGGTDDARRAFALDLLAALPGHEGRKVAGELARSTHDAARAAGLRALVRDGSKEAQRILVAVHDAADPTQKLEVVRALAGRDSPLAEVERCLLPHLTRTADAELRHAAMSALAQWRDPRLLVHLKELLPHEEQRGRRAAWLAGCARLGSVAAAAAMAELAAGDIPRADAALLELLPTMCTPAVLAWVRKSALAHAHHVVRWAGARALAVGGELGDVDALLALARDADAEVAAQALASAAGLADATRLVDVVRACNSARAGAAQRALGALWRGRLAPAAAPAGPDLVQATLQWAAEGAPTVRAAALTCLGADTPADLVQRALDDLAWQVRCAGYRCLAKTRTRASVESVMTRLPAERGPRLRAALRALSTLTGTTRSTAEDWLAWWKLAAATFTVPAAAEGKEGPAQQTADARATAAVRYHDIPVDGDRVAFVLDLSGSMREEIAGKGKTRLRMAQDELSKALLGLRPPQAFAVIGFADTAQPFASQLVPASPEHIDKACTWLAQREAKGWTNLWAGLSAALALDDVDTVFVLSDGAPSVGRFVDAHLIRAEVRARDVAGVVRIHTIALDGDRFDRAFLHGLAADSGGVCVLAQ